MKKDWIGILGLSIIDFGASLCTALSYYGYKMFALLPMLICNVIGLYMLDYYFTIILKVKFYGIEKGDKI